MLRLGVCIVMDDLEAISGWEKEVGEQGKGLDGVVGSPVGSSGGAKGV